MRKQVSKKVIRYLKDYDLRSQNYEILKQKQDLQYVIMIVSNSIYAM